jgi:hypothetical protein
MISTLGIHKTFLLYNTYTVSLFYLYHFLSPRINAARSPTHPQSRRSSDGSNLHVVHLMRTPSYEGSTAVTSKASSTDIAI